MCGICGKYNFSSENKVDEALVTKMNARLYRRGPDGAGTWLGDNAGFGIQMLHIRDRENGRQPFHSEDNSVVSVLNGEIYNYKELKEYLLKKGHSLHTNCDAEVISHLYEEHGAGFIKMLNGMFALALYDRENGVFLLARDRMGIKPLYYSITKDGVVFSSQLLSLMQDKSISDELDPKGINCYFSYNYFPIDYTPFKQAKKIMPGHYLLADSKGHKIEKYWQFNFKKHKVCSTNEYVEEFKSILKKTLCDQLVSDTALGVFVSGGIDSGILAYYTNKLQNGCKAFSVGFREKTFDERPYARNLMKYIKADHYEIELPEKLACLMDKLSDSLDMPVGEGSYVPLFALSDFAKKQSGVILSGEGADELFGGYQMYIADIAAKYYKMIPPIIRNNFLKTVIRAIPMRYEWMNCRQKMDIFYKGIADNNAVAHYFWREIFSVGEKKELYDVDFLKVLDKTDSLAEPYSLFNSNYNLANSSNYLEQAMFFDTRVCLPDGMLHRVDMASMYSSLEVRVPYLDNRMVDFAQRLPLNQKIRGVKGKCLLRKTLQSELPDNIFSRQKHGLSVPVSKWLRYDLKEFAEERLLESSAVHFINKNYIRDMLAKHCSGEIDAGRKLWNMLIFAVWISKVKR
ncbi:MAG: asparagine synthase (glutamine-hydrolyzing) [Candidatus Omnitrophota bacterium]